MRVLQIGGPRLRATSAPVRWGGLELTLTRSQFDQLVRYNQHTPEMLPQVRQARVEAFARAVRPYDAIFCETPEALILSHEWRRLGLAPRPVVALAVEGLMRVDAMRRYYAEQGDVDPWPALRRAPWVRWIASSSSQRQLLIERGVGAERVYFVQGCTAHFGMFVPDIETQLAGGPEIDAALARGLPEGGVLLPGGGRRDHVTALRAVHRLPELTFQLIDELLDHKRHQLQEAGVLPLPNLALLAPVPLPQFVALVRRARLLVVVLKPGLGDGGHTTVATAHRLGVPVVASAVPGIADYVTDGEDARLVEPGDPEKLADAIRSLLADPKAAARLCEAGRVREAERCRNAEAGLLRAFRGAVDGLASDRR